MKVNQIVSEHKKNRRAIKYNKKPTNNTIKPQGPIKPGQAVKEDATLSTGKVVANDGKTITVAMPDGTQIQKPITAVSKDEQGKPVFNLVTPQAPGQTPGAPQVAQTPQQQFPTGSNMPVNTGAPMEEEGDIGGDKTDDYIDDVEDKKFGKPRGVDHDKERLNQMLTIAGLR